MILNYKISLRYFVISMDKIDKSIVFVSLIEMIKIKFLVGFSSGKNLYNYPQEIRYSVIVKEVSNINKL